jgi:hypothetical protein
MRAIAFALLAACTSTGSDKGSTPDAPPDAWGQPCGGIFASVEMNHGHTLAIPAADSALGEDRRYETSGTANHTHYVDITAAQFIELRSPPLQVTVRSAVAVGHTHDVIVICGGS